MSVSTQFLRILDRDQALFRGYSPDQRFGPGRLSDPVGPDTRMFCG